MNAVSVVICVKDCEHLIAPCIQSVRENNPAEIIVVDGKSRDRTREIAENLGARVVSDDGRGLAYARRVGALSAREKNVLYIGPDNVLPLGFIADILRLGEEWGFQVVGAQTRVYQPTTYSDRALDFRWRCLMGAPGPREVVGTPTLYRNGVLIETNYEESSANSDDTDIAERMRSKGVRLGVVPLLIYDLNGITIRASWNKFRWYGAGDAHFYRNYAPVWPARRKLISVTHPLRQTLRFISRATLEGKYSVIPWLWMVMVARYIGWYKKARALKRGKGTGTG